MLNFLIGLFSFLSGACLSLAVLLHYRDKIEEMKQDWMDALRKQREQAYTDGYANGSADEKIVQAAKKDFHEGLTAVLPKIDDSTAIMRVVS